MAFDETLAARIRSALSEQTGLTEKKMFGGIAFMINGNMCVGVSNDSLMARVGADKASLAFVDPNIGPFGPTGRPMKDWVLISPAGIEQEADFKGWLQQAVEFTIALPPK